MDAPQPSPLAVAIAWVSRITTIALAMVVPAIAGQWIDARLGTGWCGPTGLVVGFTGGLGLLVNLTRTGTPGSRPRSVRPGVKR